MVKPRRSGTKLGSRVDIQRRKKGTLLVIIVLAFLIITGWIVNHNIKPPLLKISGLRAKNKAVQAINEAIISDLGDKIEYRDLFQIRNDDNNKITILQANTMFMNSIAAKAVLSVQNSLKDMSIEKIELPLGSILGSDVFANYGPKLKIKVLPLGTVTVDFVTGFEEAGINQTRHKIHLAVNTQVGIVLPLIKDTINIDTQIPISETIIVGDIPKSYIFVPESSVPSIIPERAK